MTKPRHREWIVLAIILIILIAIRTAGTWAFGYRLNLQTASVPLPAPTASPEDVVRAYVNAYNHRDFDTRNALDPNERSIHHAYRHEPSVP